MVQRVSHTCTKSKEIDSIQDKVDKLTVCVPVLEREVNGIIKTLEGNGHKGLKEVVIILGESVEKLSGQIEESKVDRKELRTSIDNLRNYKSTLETTFTERDKSNSEREVRKTHVRWLIALLVASILSLATLYVNLQKKDREIKTLNTEIKMEEKK
jgi:hypothetical protein